MFSLDSQLSAYKGLLESVYFKVSVSLKMLWMCPSNLNFLKSFLIIYESKQPMYLPALTAHHRISREQIKYWKIEDGKFGVDICSMLNI